MTSENYLKNKTPAELQCVVGACPAIYESENNTYIVIGKQLDPKTFNQGELENKVAKHEALIEIPVNLLEGVLKYEK